VSRPLRRILQEREAHKTQRRHLGNQPVGERGLAIHLLGSRPDLALREVAGKILDGLLFLGQIEIHSPKV